MVSSLLRGLGEKQDCPDGDHLLTTGFASGDRTGRKRVLMARQAFIVDVTATKCSQDLSCRSFTDNEGPMPEPQLPAGSRWKIFQNGRQWDKRLRWSPEDVPARCWPLLGIASGVVHGCAQCIVYSVLPARTIVLEEFQYIAVEPD
jgi:hypothetical protein